MRLKTAQIFLKQSKNESKEQLNQLLTDFHSKTKELKMAQKDSKMDKMDWTH